MIRLIDDLACGWFAIAMTRDLMMLNFVGFLINVFAFYMYYLFSGSEKED